MPVRADVLRELNLYPLWQLRGRPAATPVPVAVEKTQEEPASSTKPPLEPVKSPETTEVGTEHLNWSQLKKRVTDCTACGLRSGCIQTVFGTGDKDADWLFVGSWPSEDDETRGEPFAGQAGQLLDNMLAAIGLKRGENVYLANVVKCSGSIKRAPQKNEIDRCAPYLIRQIQLIQPRIIVVLGHAAATAMLGEDSEWNSLLGKVHEFRNFSKDASSQAIPLIITHHPAALLLTPVNKAQAWRDLCLARNTMQ
jgi:DNA polymerase